MRFAYLALIIIAATVVGLYAGGNQAEAHTAASGSYYTLTIREDAFVNWDFRSKSVSASNVDWPVNMLFYNNAEIDKVKDALDALPNTNIGRCGSSKHAQVDDGSGMAWDSDGGIKDDCSSSPPSEQARHMRVYADGDDRLFNLSYGYYIIGTTHAEDCHKHGVWPITWCHHHWVGHSEIANDWWDYYSRQVAGWIVYSDWGSFSNFADEFDAHGSGEDHHVVNDGRATFVNVP